MKKELQHLLEVFLRLSIVAFLLLASLAITPAAPVAAKLSPSGITAPDDSHKFGSFVTHLPNGNWVVIDHEYGPAGALKIGAVYLYDSAWALLDTMTGVTAGDQVGSGGIVIMTDGNFVIASPRWNNPDTGAAMAGAVTWCSATAGCPAVVDTTTSLVGSALKDAVGGSYMDLTYYSDSPQVMALDGGAYLVNSYYWNNWKGEVTYCTGGGDANCIGVVSASNSLVGAKGEDKINTNDSADYIGINVTIVPGGYVVNSSYWNNGGLVNAGISIPCAFANGGCKGVAAASMGLHGTRSPDQVGMSAVALEGGGYVVQSYGWNGTVGAATFCASITDPNCLNQAVSATNSLTASSGNSQVGSHGFVALPNGDYLVKSPSWVNGSSIRTGALTICNVTGSGNSAVSSCNNTTVTTANSVTGDWNGDSIGTGVTLLTGGALVTNSQQWHNYRGAATYCSSADACKGVVVSTANSMTGVNSGTSSSDQWNGDAAAGGAKLLADGSYLVLSPNWKRNRGAVTYCPATGCIGSVSEANSLVGSVTDSEQYKYNGDMLGHFGVLELPNHALLVISPQWADTAANRKFGAVTYCSDYTACMGQVAGKSNSLYYDNALADGGLTVSVFADSSYTVGAPYWSNGIQPQLGIITRCPASGCTNLLANASNSITGAVDYDYVGYNQNIEVGDGLYVANNEYIITGPGNITGALMLCRVATGCSNVIAPGNSVFGAAPYFPDYSWHANYQYDLANHRLVVGLPMDNKVVFFDLKPSAVTSAATSVGMRGATLNATANAFDAATTVSFEYGLTTAYGTTVTAAQSPLSGVLDTAVSKTLTGLKPSTTYHYRARVTNVEGTTYGEDQTFTTLEQPVCTAASTGTVLWSVFFGSCPAGAKYIIPAGLTVQLDDHFALDGDLEVLGALDTSTYQKTMTLTGEYPQALSGNPLTFYNLIVNKTNKTDTVTITGKLKVTKKLTLTKGKLVSASDYGDIEIEVDGTLELTNPISVSGSFINNGTLITNGNAITFDGDGTTPQTVTTGSTASFGDVAVGPTTELVLTNDIQITGDLTIDGVFTSDTHKVTFDSGGIQHLMVNNVTLFDDFEIAAGTTVVEDNTDDNIKVLGTFTNYGTIQKEQTITGADTYYFGLTGDYNGDSLVLNVTNPGTVETILIKRIDSDHPNNVNTIEQTVGLERYWQITTSGSGYEVDVILPHNVNGAAYACRYITSWYCRDDANPLDAGSTTTATFLGSQHFSDWAIGTGNLPTPALVSALNSSASPAGIDLSWSTNQETDLLGFRVYRSASRDGARSLLTPELITAQFPGQPVGADYLFRDSSLRAGQSAYYWLEMLRADGSVVLEPLRVTSPFGLFLPLLTIH